MESSLTMKTRRSFLLCILLGLGGTGITAAQSPLQDLYSPVILGYRSPTTGTLTFTPLQVRPDGSGRQDIAFLGGDLSRGGVDGFRHFLRVEDRVTDPFTDLVAYHESGDPASRTVLTAGASFSHTRQALNGYANPRWSNDGSAVLFHGQRLNPDGSVAEEGIFAGDVTYDGGAPAAVTDERLVVASPPPNGSHTYQLLYVSWMSDNRRIAFIVIDRLWGAPGQLLASTRTLWVVDVPPVGGMPPAPVQVTFANFSGDPRAAIASPAAGDQRIAFRQGGSNNRWEIYTVPVPPGYGGSPLAVTPINARSTFAMERIEWSPDGVFLAFEAHGNAKNVYTIRADGSGRQTTLLSQSKTNFDLSQWRR